MCESTHTHATLARGETRSALSADDARETPRGPRPDHIYQREMDARAETPEKTDYKKVFSNKACIYDARAEKKLSDHVIDRVFVAMSFHAACRLTAD